VLYCTSKMTCVWWVILVFFVHGKCRKPFKYLCFICIRSNVKFQNLGKEVCNQQFICKIQSD
jgi:hypothetical protein